MCRAPGSRSRGAAGLAGRPAGRRGQLRGRPAPRQRGDRLRRAETMHGGASPRCCWSTWCRWPGMRGLRAFTAETLRGQLPRCCGCSPTPGCRLGGTWSDGVVGADLPAARGDGDAGLGGYLDRWPSPRKPGRCGQPAAPAAARVGRRDRRQPAPRVGRPGDPAQHRDRRLRRAGLRGQPARPARWRACSACHRWRTCPSRWTWRSSRCPPRPSPTRPRNAGSRGVRALVVITAGLGPAGPDLLAICRRYGMRLAGPNCFGIAVPGLGLDATFGARHPRPAARAWSCSPAASGSRCSSSCPGWASASRRSRRRRQVRRVQQRPADAGGSRTADPAGRAVRGVVRQPAQVRPHRAPGRPADAGADRASPAGPRRAARRRLAHRGRGTPLVTQEALFAQAGIIATRSLGELIDAAALLASQPLPAGDRVAIVSNAGGAGVLAADACGDHGLSVAALTARDAAGARQAAAAGAAVAGPVDTTAAVTAAAFRGCLEQAAADDGRRRGAGRGRADRRRRPAARRRARPGWPKPLAAAFRCSGRGAGCRCAGPRRPAGSRGRGPRRCLPTPIPESAARALGHARPVPAPGGTRPHGQVPGAAGVRAR